MYLTENRHSVHMTGFSWWKIHSKTKSLGHFKGIIAIELNASTLSIHVCNHSLDLSAWQVESALIYVAHIGYHHKHRHMRPPRARFNAGGYRAPPELLNWISLHLNLFY